MLCIAQICGSSRGSAGSVIQLGGEKHFLETNLRDRLLRPSALVMAAVFRRPLDMVSTHSGI